ncbi:MAG: hypothetical protein Q8S20_14855 [Sulfuritalea sp.]|nr:hypothetical protein [Sulfuritalea sp.]
MANATLFALENFQHRKLGGPCLGLEQMIMAIRAIQPKRMLAMREAHDRHAAF